MLATEILQGEHRVIEQVLDCLEKLIADTDRDSKLDSGAARQMIDFFRGFADQCHHGKEEAHLFPVCEQRGFPAPQGPTAVMRAEHEYGRSLLKGMQSALDAAAQGNRQAVKAFSENGRQYLEFLREHIRKEDHCLFPMVDDVLTDEDQKALVKAFDKVEHEKMSSGAHEKFLKIANDLASRYGVLRHPASQTKSCGCHHQH